MSREALKLALEALEEINKLSIGENAICLPAEIDTAMDACRKVLAQPEYQSTADKSKLEKVPAKGTLLAQPEQEFVCSTGLCHYRKPPQFPTMLRKMWSGTEVQEWINENWSKT